MATNGSQAVFTVHIIAHTHTVHIITHTYSTYNYTHTYSTYNYSTHTHTVHIITHTYSTVHIITHTHTYSTYICTCTSICIHTVLVQCTDRYSTMSTYPPVQLEWRMPRGHCSRRRRQSSRLPPPGYCSTSSGSPAPGVNNVHVVGMCIPKPSFTCPLECIFCRILDSRVIVS